MFRTQICNIYLQHYVAMYIQFLCVDVKTNNPNCANDCENERTKKRYRPTERERVREKDGDGEIERAKKAAI